MPDKPIDVGLKYYAVCCPYTGYTFCIKLHSDAPEPHEEEWGRILAIVYDLLSGESTEGSYCFLDKGYFVSCLQPYCSCKNLCCFF